MKTKRICKILVAALAATLVLAFAVSFSACGEDSSDGVSESSSQNSSYSLTFSPSKNGSGYVVTGIGDWIDSNLVISSEYNGMPVVEIGYKAFYDEGYDLNEDYFLENGKFEWLYSYAFIKTVTIPDSVKIINEAAFYGCAGIESLIMGKGVMVIGRRAFYDCDSLTVVYYSGTEEEWNMISIGDSNDSLTSAARYYYSETEPADEGNFWHYVDGAATVWGE